MGSTGRPPPPAAVAADATRVRRAPPPAARPSSPSDEEADEPEPAELIEVKIEPDAWLQQVQDTPRRRDVRDMLQLGEQLGSPLVMLPRGEYMVGRPRQTAKDAAAAAGADDDFDSNSDTMPPDHDQFLDSDQGGGTKAAEDEDLTSLSWLQDSNLLKAIPLSAPAVRPRVEQRLQREPSPGEDRLSASPPGDPDSDPDHPTFDAKRYLDHNSYAYDPYLHASFKPPFSFSCLIFMAIEDSFHKALPVREIYGWITEHFPFYKEAADGWKNSVRHNLSLSKCFKRVERSPHRPWMNHGPKGSFWMVEPHYRNSLIHALQRSHSLYGWKQQAATGREPPVKLAKGPYSHSVKRRKVAVSGDGGPDPSLFPFLAARLMSGDKPKRSPVDPLALPEPNSASELLTPGLSVYNRLREGRLELTGEESESADLDRVRLPRVMMISRSAYDDHTYAYCPRPERPPSSEDIDFGDGGGEQSDGAASDGPEKASPETRGSRWRGHESRPSSGRSGELTPEEVEGADLLLNLAGVSRSGSRSQSPQPAAAPAPPDPPRRRRGRPRGSGRGRGRGRGSRS